MKLRCQRALLATAFQTVSSVVPSKTHNAILQNVKLAASGGVELSGTDTEIGIRYELSGVEVETPGAVLLPTSRVSAILRELRSEMVSIEATDEATIVSTTCSEFRLPSADAVEFPDVSTFDEANYTIAADVLRRSIRRTLFACDVYSTRYALGGILLDVDGSEAAFVATDGRRLSVVATAIQCHAEPAPRQNAPVIPAKAMSVLERSLGDSTETVSIAVNTNDVLFKTSVVTLYSRLMEGRFPAWRGVVPESCEVTVNVLAGPLYSAVRQAMILTNDESRGVDFRFADGKVTLQGQAADVGASRIELPLSYDAEQLTITFDARFVADFLKVLEPEQSVEIRMTDGDKAAVLSVDGYRYVIMPLSKN